MRRGGRLWNVLGATCGVLVTAVAALSVAPVAVAAPSLALTRFVAGPLLSGGTLIWQDTAG